MSCVIIMKGTGGRGWCGKPHFAFVDNALFACRPLSPSESAKAGLPTLTPRETCKDLVQFLHLWETFRHQSLVRN